MTCILKSFIFIIIIIFHRARFWLYLDLLLGKITHYCRFLSHTFLDMSSDVASYISLMDCTNRLCDVFELGNIITIRNAKTVPIVMVM